MSGGMSVDRILAAQNLHDPERSAAKRIEAPERGWRIIDAFIRHCAKSAGCERGKGHDGDCRRRQTR